MKMEWQIKSIFRSSLKLHPPPQKKKKRNKKHKNNQLFFQSYRLWSERKFRELSSHTFRSPPAKKVDIEKIDQTTNSPVYVITYHKDPLELWNNFCIYYVYPQQDGRFRQSEVEEEAYHPLVKKESESYLGWEGAGSYFTMLLHDHNHHLWSLDWDVLWNFLSLNTI